MEKQPAKVSYFFRQGYIDLWNTIRDSWKANIVSALDSFNKGSDVWWVWKFFWWASGICVVVFGTVWFLVLSTLHIVILFIFFLIIYFLFTFTWVLDFLFRVKEGIFAACPNPGCYEKSRLPIYRCPACNAEHTQLWPSKYGIWKRTCSCGEKLPCTFFNDRGKLPAICPHPQCRKPMNTEEGTPLIIPIIGPPNAGKSTYLYSMLDNLTSEFTGKGYEVYSNINQKQINDSIHKLTSFDIVDKTVDHETKAVDMIISKGSTKYAIYFYDVAGEAFGASKNIEQHKFYGYFSAMMFLLDPFAIEQVRDEYYEEFNSHLKKMPLGSSNPYDKAMGLTEVYTNLTLNLAEHYDIKDEMTVKQSFAVIIPKTDLFSDEVLASDKDCRGFLAWYGQSSFVEQITWKFKNVRFFNVVSKGKNSIGVLQPFEWILKRDMKQKQVRRFFGNLLMVFFILIVLGGLALGGMFGYKAISDFSFNWRSKPEVVETPAPGSLQPNYYCNANSLNVRSEANTNATVIGKLTKGQDVYVYSIDSITNFAKIDYNGTPAYTSADYLVLK